MKGTILLTGFEPFGRSDINPSIMACNKFGDRKIRGYDVKVLEIPLRFKEIKKDIETAIEEFKPSIIICTGQSGRTVISLERVAINIADIKKFAYNCGTTPKDEELEKDGPAGYFSTLPIREIYEKLEQNKIPVEISNSAGAFGCNQIFYHLMNFINMKDYTSPAGFIHVPSLPEQVIGRGFPSMSLNLITEALEIVINTVIDYIEK